MAALSKKLRSAENGLVLFWCPGCDEAHQVRVTGDARPKWGWNGNVDKPTFTPSVLVTNGHFLSTWKQGDSCWCTYNQKHPESPVRFKCKRCHSFVTDGCIKFLADCSHGLAGKTVDIPDFDL